MKQVKILFVLGDDGWDGSSSETLWATPSENGFVLDNYPFFVKGICFRDLVEANEISDGLYEYVRTLKKSNNSLYRVLFKASDSISAIRSLKRLEKLGCAYETDEMDAMTLVAVNLPETVDANQAWKIFEAGVNDGVWEVQEGDDRHPHN